MYKRLLGPPPHRELMRDSKEILPGNPRHSWLTPLDPWLRRLGPPRLQAGAPWAGSDGHPPPHPWLGSLWYLRRKGVIENS